MRLALAAVALAVALTACPAAPAPAPSLAGTWRGTFVSAAGSTTYHVQLVSTDGEGLLEGRLEFCHADFSCDGKAYTVSGSREGASVTWRGTGSDGGTITGAGTVAGHRFSGTFEAEVAGKFSLTRLEEPSPFR